MALLKYAGLRFAMFLVVAALLYAVGVRNLLVNAMIAILISGLASLFLLDRVRNEAGASLEQKVGRSPFQRISDRMDAAARAEDEADDAARAARAAREAAAPASTAASDAIGHKGGDAESVDPAVTDPQSPSSDMEGKGRTD